MRRALVALLFLLVLLRLAPAWAQTIDGAPTFGTAISSTVTSLSVTCPTPSTSTDLVLLCATVDFGAGPFVGTPSGTTAIPNTSVNDGANSYYACWSQVLSSSSAPSYTVNWTTGAEGVLLSNMAICILYKGANTSTPIRASNGVACSTASTTIPQCANSVTGTAGDLLVQHTWSRNCTGCTYVSNSLGTKEFYDSSTTSRVNAIADSSIASTGTISSPTFAISGSHSNGGALIDLEPAGGGGPTPTATATATATTTVTPTATPSGTPYPCATSRCSNIGSGPYGYNSGYGYRMGSCYGQ
jgi:hypothetical protein